MPSGAEGARSPIVKGSLSQTTFDAPDGIQASDGDLTDPKSITITWLIAAGVTEGYDVYRAADTSSGYVYIGSSTTNKFIDTTALANTKYFYKLVSIKYPMRSGLSTYDTGFLPQQ